MSSVNLRLNHRTCPINSILDYSSNRDVKKKKSPLDNLFENEIRGAVKGWGMEIKEIGGSSRRMYIRNAGIMRGYIRSTADIPELCDILLGKLNRYK